MTHRIAKRLALALAVTMFASQNVQAAGALAIGSCGANGRS
jgi:hypothetical protein